MVRDRGSVNQGGDEREQGVPDGGGDVWDRVFELFDQDKEEEEQAGPPPVFSGEAEIIKVRLGETADIPCSITKPSKSRNFIFAK